MSKKINSPFYQSLPFSFHHEMSLRHNFTYTVKYFSRNSSFIFVYLLHIGLLIYFHITSFSKAMSLPVCNCTFTLIILIFTFINFPFATNTYERHIIYSFIIVPTFIHLSLIIWFQISIFTIKDQSTFFNG